MVSDDRNRNSFLEIIEARSPIDGRFTNLKRLGDNGGGGYFSLLFTAYDLKLRREVALKFYRPDKMAERYRWDSFVREAELLEQLAGQDDIVTLVAPRSGFVIPLTTPQGISVEIPFAYYAVELALGDVREAIAHGRWDARKLLLAFRIMCRAVQRLHANQIVHRDVKPDNFLVMGAGIIKLSDLGTARMLKGSIPAVGQNYIGPAGDMTYAAPEVIACLHDAHPDIAYAADIFSLGAVLFEMFSGTYLLPEIFDDAFVGGLLQAMNRVAPEKRRDTYHAFVDSIVAGHPLPSLSKFGPSVPPSIRDRLDDLYQSMAALDYRRRLRDFARIFQKTNVCLQILEHEAAYRRLRELKRHRAMA